MIEQQKPQLKLLAKLAAITVTAAERGIEKQKGEGVSYKFRAWNHVNDFMSEMLSIQKILCGFKQTQLSSSERVSAKGTISYYSEVSILLELMDAESGESFVFGPFLGASALTNDRGQSAALSYAKKEAFCSIFSIPFAPTLEEFAAEVEVTAPSPKVERKAKPFPGAKIVTHENSSIPARISLDFIKEIGADRAVLEKKDWSGFISANSAEWLARKGKDAEAIAKEASVFFATPLTLENDGEIAIVRYYTQYKLKEAKQL